VLAFIIRRFLIAIPLVIVSSFLVFIMVASSGTPQPLENARLRPNPNPAQIRVLELRYHLDKPLVTRYWLWLKDAAHGDLGVDNNSRPVGEQLRQGMLVTLRLVVVALVIAILIALVVGVVSALRQYSVFDYSSTFASFLFFSLPVFWLAVLLKEFGAIRFNNLIGHTWVYTVGEQSVRLPHSFWARMGDYAGHMVLPCLTLVLISFAQYSRFTRASMLETMNADYVRTATAKGATRKRVVTRHALRNALIPVTTVVALDFGAVLGGAIITERVFQWRGMGTLLIRGVTQYDPNLVQGWLMVTAVTVVVFNLLADITYAWLDPRIRL